MSDCASVTITIANRDRDAFCNALDVEPNLEEECPESGTVGLVFDDWNYPSPEEFFVPGVPFFGCHGEGYEYDSHLLAGDGERSRDWPCTREYMLFVELDAHGNPDPGGLEKARAFVAFEGRSRFLVAGRAVRPARPHGSPPHS